MFRDRLAWGLRLLLPPILACSLACAHVPEQTGTEQRAGLESSTGELRTRAVELGRGAMREIEIASDSIDAGTTDTRIRRNTLLLRLSSLSALTEAVLREDPVVAMLDLYAFRIQLSDYLTSPAGSAALGPDVTIAGRAMERFAAEWEATAVAIGARIKDEGRVKLESWAHEHPIDRLPITRSSLVGELARTLREQQTSIGAVMGGMQESLDRLEFRVSLANEYAVKQAMWLSQFATLELGSSPEVREMTGTLTSTRGLVEDTPDLVARERAAILADVERQRHETLEMLIHERTLLIQTLASERTLVIEAVIEQRIRVLQEVDSLRVRVIADEIRVVDHLMLRVVQILAGLLVLAGGGLFLLRRRLPAL